MWWVCAPACVFVCVLWQVRARHIKYRCVWSLEINKESRLEKVQLNILPKFLHIECFSGFFILFMLKVFCVTYLQWLRCMLMQYLVVVALRLPLNLKLLFSYQWQHPAKWEYFVFWKKKKKKLFFPLNLFWLCGTTGPQSLLPLDKKI